MKRSYIYIIVILLTISLTTADYIIGKDLKRIIPLDETYRTVEDVNLVKEANVTTTLTIKNEQNTDEKITYKYTLKIKELAGAHLYKYNDKENYLVFTANGETTFKLNSNESITIYEIPVDLEYTITQETTNDKYITKVNKVEKNTYTGKIAGDDNITFNNATKYEETKPAKEEPKKEEEQPKKEEKEEDNKPAKKDIPNTGESEIKMVAVLLLLSLLLIYCIRKRKVKRFE